MMMMMMKGHFTPNKGRRLSWPRDSKVMVYSYLSQWPTQFNAQLPTVGFDLADLTHREAFPHSDHCDLQTTGDRNKSAIN